MSKKIEVVSVEKKGEYVSYSSVTIDEYFADSADLGEKLLSHSFLMDSFRKIMGRTLTTIDASIVDTKQNKAIKDLIRGIFSDEMDFSASMSFDQDKLQLCVPEDIDIENLGVTTIEEALGVN